MGGPCLLARLRRVRDEAGFTMVEMLITTLVLAVISAPIAAVLVSSNNVTGQARLRTAANQAASAKVEGIHAMTYDSVGIGGGSCGNPSGTLTSPDPSVTAINGAPVSLTYQVTFVSDPASSIVTYADYKKVVVTVTRTSDNKVLAQKTTYLAAAAAAPDNGGDYVAMKRTIVDSDGASTPISGVPVTATVGPSAPRCDTSDSTGNVTFPAMNALTTGSKYDVTAVKSGYSTHPLDLPPFSAGEATLYPGNLDGPKLLRLYKNGITTTVNLFQSNGTTPYLTSSTVYMGSQTAGQSVLGVTTGSTVISQLVLGNTYVAPAQTNIQIPPGTYTFAAFASETGAGCPCYRYSNPTASPAQPLTVPNNYPTDLTKTAKVTMYANTVPTASTGLLTVTVKKSGVNVQNAHVEVKNTATANANAPNVYLFGLTNSSGQATFTVPRSTNKYTVQATDGVGATYLSAPPTNGVTVNSSSVSVTLNIT